MPRPYKKQFSCTSQVKVQLCLGQQYAVQKRPWTIIAAASFLVTSVLKLDHLAGAEPASRSSRPCHVQMQISLPSGSANTQNAGASAS
jgi:hypothetical protein